VGKVLRGGDEFIFSPLAQAVTGLQSHQGEDFEFSGTGL